MYRSVSRPRHGLILLTSLLLAGIPGSARAEPLVEQVRKSIAQGVQYLRNLESGRGNWEHMGQQIAASNPGGCTCLATLALLNAGVKPDDPIIQRSLSYLRGVEPQTTYVVGLQTMVFAEAGFVQDKERIQRNVNWLVKARVYDGEAFRGWTYRSGASRFADNSNTQYALLGLHAGKTAGATISPGVFREIRDFYVNTQRQGGWGYSSQLEGPRLTMVTAGLCGLLIAGMDLNQGREVLRNGTADNCGVYEESGPITEALAWIGEHFRLQDRFSTYYNIYGIERAGRLSGLRFFGSHDWYREGCLFLVERQSDNGSWTDLGGTLTHSDSNAVVASSFALLFLSKGRTPVLISKMVHGVDPASTDWNNDRNDVRHLVAYAGTEVFKNKPLAWQVFNPRKLPLENPDDRNDVLREMLATPIVYFNGHKVPHFTDGEEDLLRKYVEQGGFIFAEACCGKPAFDVGFRELVTRLFPDTPLRPLPPEHPVWRAHALIRPDDLGKNFTLYGIEMGCKTVLVYSPQDLSCYWESNRLDLPAGRQAFRLGGNVIAYATGMEPPKPRLTEAELVAGDGQPALSPRGFLKVGQLRHTGDWQPAPKAMRTLLQSLRRTAHIDVALKTEELLPNRNELIDSKLIYMHGRGDFSFPRGAIKFLRANLETGGLMLADACCGRQAFDAAFRAFAAELFPGQKLQPIPLDDELFGKDLNGTAITSVRCRRERPDGTGVTPEFQDGPPYLEGIKIDGRWVVIYSKFDLGCALETPKPTATDCLGHDHESAVRLAGAAVLYALKR